MDRGQHAGWGAGRPARRGLRWRVARHRRRRPRTTSPPGSPPGARRRPCPGTSSCSRPINGATRALRQIVSSSLSAKRLRVRVSNVHRDGPAGDLRREHRAGGEAGRARRRAAVAQAPHIRRAGRRHHPAQRGVLLGSGGPGARRGAATSRSRCTPEGPGGGDQPPGLAHHELLRQGQPGVRSRVGRRDATRRLVADRRHGGARRRGTWASWWRSATRSPTGTARRPTATTAGPTRSCTACSARASGPWPS